MNNRNQPTARGEAFCIGRAVLILIASTTLLTGCLATSEDLNQPTAAQPLVDPNAPTKLPVAKDEKLLEERNRLNKYVNQKAPSQLRYSLQVLNQDLPADSAYPTIEDLSTDDSRLRTPEDRKRLKDELEALNR